MTIARVSGLALVAALVILNSPESEARSKRRGARPFALRAHAVDFTKDSHSKRRVRQRSFEGHETHTIEFDVYRRGRSALERPTQVKLYLPNGDLYGAIDVVLFEGKVESGRHRRRTPEATARVRVSNTAITRFALYGKWRADVCWDTGTTTSCRRGLRFSIH